MIRILMLTPRCRGLSLPTLEKGCGRIVTETFVRILKRDGDVPGFSPSHPSSVAGQFMIADMLEFAGVLVQ